MMSVAQYVEQLRSEAKDAAGAASLLARLDEAARGLGSADQAEARVVFGALLAVGDEVLGRAVVADSWASAHLGAAMFWLLRAMGAEAARAAIEAATPTPGSVMTMVILCDWLAVDPLGDGQGTEMLRALVDSLGADVVDRLRERALGAVRARAAGPDLLEVPYPWWVLRFWKDSAGPNEAADALLMAAADDHLLVALASRAFYPPLLLTDVCWALLPHADEWIHRISAAEVRAGSAGSDDERVLLGRLRELVQRCEMQAAGRPGWRLGVTDDDRLP